MVRKHEKANIVDISVGVSKKKKPKPKPKKKKMEKKKTENKKTDCIEISDGDMYLRIPKNQNYEQVAGILLSFEERKEQSEESVEIQKVIRDGMTEKPDIQEMVSEEPVLDANMKRCPKCNRKLKMKTRREGNKFIKSVRCKGNKRFGKKCDFEHQFEMGI